MAKRKRGRQYKPLPKGDGPSKERASTEEKDSTVGKKHGTVEKEVETSDVEKKVRQVGENRAVDAGDDQQRERVPCVPVAPRDGEGRDGQGSVPPTVVTVDDKTHDGSGENDSDEQHVSVASKPKRAAASIDVAPSSTSFDRSEEVGMAMKGRATSKSSSHNVRQPLLSAGDDGSGSGSGIDGQSDTSRISGKQGASEGRLDSDASPEQGSSARKAYNVDGEKDAGHLGDTSSRHEKYDEKGNLYDEKWRSGRKGKKESHPPREDAPLIAGGQDDVASTSSKYSCCSSSETDLTVVSFSDIDFTQPRYDENSVVRKRVFAVSPLRDTRKFQRTNMHIRHGYRVDFSRDLLTKSIFMRHNETMCIWSHLLPAIIMFFVIILTFLKMQNDLTDFVVVGGYAFGAFLCFAFSALYHTYRDFGPCSMRKYLCCDYLGITFFICTSELAVIIFSLAYDKKIRNIYASILLVITLTNVVLNTIPKLLGTKYDVYRTILFVCISAFSVVPLVHLTVACKVPGSVQCLVYDVAVWRVLVTLLLYGIGLFFFVTGFPESIRPGKHDMWNSHVFWHIFVAISGLYHFYVVVTLYELYSTHFEG